MAAPLKVARRVAESDMLLVPDLGTYAVLPWTDGEGNTARLICSVYTQEGQPFLGDPRSKLIQVLGEIEELGYAFHTGGRVRVFSCSVLMMMESRF